MSLHDTSKYITPAWLCVTLGVKSSTIDSWRKRCAAPSIVVDTNIGKRVYFERTAFLKWFISYAEQKTGKTYAARRRAMLHALESGLATLDSVEKTASAAPAAPAETQPFISLELSRNETFSLTFALRNHLDFELDGALNNGVDSYRAGKIRDIVRVLSRLHDACLHKANLFS